MERNTNSQVPSEFCSNNCGFYGNPACNNMCSKCFKEFEGEKLDNNAEGTTISPENRPYGDSSAELRKVMKIDSGHMTTLSSAKLAETSSEIVSLVSKRITETKPRVVKGRCFKCKSKIPLVKQTTNKCRCENVFCDSHKFPDQHECGFDFLERDRKQIEKNNPKLNEQPRGGRSFTRIE